MIGLDTNVLVRYLTEDDAAQSSAAAGVIEALTEDEPGFVSLVTVVELLWVLRRAYRVPERESLPVLDHLLSTHVIRLERSDVVRLAMRDALATSADFADALTARLGSAAGCTTTLTFDRTAADLAGMTLLEVGQAD